MTPAVSLLVPVYNVEKFIERCAISLFEQTFEDIEYIFVDDATPDNSIEILKNVAAKYPNRKIKIITHKENKGLASARRTAIENANGEYILMCDSDDYIELNTVQLLYDAAIKINADVAVCDVILEYLDRSKILSDNVAQTNNFSNMLMQKGTISSFCNKIIRKILFDKYGLLAPPGFMYLEDTYAILRLYYYAVKIVKVNKALYHYTQYNTNAITKKIDEIHFKNTITFYQELEGFLIQNQIKDKYVTQIKELKKKTKLMLLWAVSDKSLRYKYSTMFDEDTKYLERYQKLSDRLMLCTARRKSTLWITSLLKKLVEIKQKIRNFVRITKIN